MACPKCTQRILVPTPPRPTPAPVNKTVLGKIEENVPAKAPVSPPMPSSAVPSSAAVTTNPPPIPAASFADPDRPAPQPAPTANKTRLEIPAPVIHVHAEGPSSAAHSLGIASLVLGCMAIVLSLIPCVGMISLPLSGLGFLLAAVGVVIGIVRKGRGIGFSIAGVGINGLALLIGSFWALLAAGMSASADKAVKVNQTAEAKKESAAQSPQPLKPEAVNESKQDGPDNAAKKSNPPIALKDAETELPSEWPDASKSSVRQGDIRVKVTSVKIGIVDLVDSRNKPVGRSKDELLQINLTVENVSENRLIRFNGWGSRDFAKQPTLRDDFGNSYRTNRFGIFSHPVGQVSNEKPIYPGKTTSDTIIFDPPIKGAKWFRLTLPAESFGGNGQLQMQIPSEMVRPIEKNANKILDIVGRIGFDDKTPNGKLGKVYTVDLKADRTYVIDLISLDFDSYLYLFDSKGKLLAQDDDSGGNLDAMIVFRPENDGTYFIHATTLSGRQTGAFSLVVRNRD